MRWLAAHWRALVLIVVLIAFALFFRWVSSVQRPGLDQDMMETSK